MGPRDVAEEAACALSPAAPAGRGRRRRIMSNVMISSPGGSFPSVPFHGMDTLWFQVAGTICNLRCTHCFISCAPDNHSHGMLPLAEVKRRLEEAVRLGVKDYYFTGRRLSHAA